MDTNIKYTLEAALIASGESLSISQMIALFADDNKVGAVDTVDIQTALEELSKDYQERGLELKKVASGYRLQLKAPMAQKVLSLWQEKPQKYSRALLETLALIAYRQPITRGDIEDVRGVSVSSQIIKTLLERDWVKIVGHRDVPGRPAMYATTNAFLDYFNLENLSQLPELSEIRELDEQNRRLQFNDDNPPPEQIPLNHNDKEDSKQRERQVLDETEQDLTTAASLVAQVEANVFAKETTTTPETVTNIRTLVEQLKENQPHDTATKTPTDRDNL